MTTLFTDIEIAGRSLANHTRRSLLIGCAIASVTALLVLLAGLTAGIRAAMVESATTFVSGHVNVGGFFKVSPGVAVPVVTDYQEVLATVRAAVPELTGTTVRGRGYARVVGQGGAMGLALAGVDIHAEDRFRRAVQITQGRLDDLAEPGTVLLFEGQAKRLGVRVGDALTLVAYTSRGMHNSVDVRVAAVAKDLGLLSSFIAFLPAETLLQLHQIRPSTTGVIQLYLKDPADSARVAARVRAALARGGYQMIGPDAEPFPKKLARETSLDWVGQKLDVSTWEDELSSLTWIVRALQGLGGLLVAALLAIVIAGILNTLAIAIRERTREIGTLRAIGMQRPQVLWLFLLEAALLGAAGAGAGSLAGAAVATAINAANIAVPEAVRVLTLQRRLTLALDLGSIVAYAAAIAGATTLASLFPAWRAARLRPVTAMYHIG